MKSQLYQRWRQWQAGWEEWSQWILAFKGFPEHPGDFVLGSSTLVLKPLVSLGTWEKTHVRPWVYFLRNELWLPWGLGLANDMRQETILSCFSFLFKKILNVLSKHIIMRKIEGSKAGQASINVLGRGIVFKILGTIVVIKAFDLF